ncbi:hypothetical protein [Desulfoferrobacter suflitae]|uniref:hypothetical protein n=1 Tax=Desulfoferrobacter suflitae TaxID=2865782 RepID=UPI0021644A74|nr:hypothetical protein [Desulfoferrobacter suflitae]MCK8600252.1 hypothetical protein [Desulfoferrobacter suflitae]
MSSASLKKLEIKTGLKQLRELRKETITAATTRMKEQKQIIKAIKNQLQQPTTVPAIAEAAGIPPHMVLWYVAALKKYGEVKEVDKDGCYFRYCSIEAS